MPAPIGNRNAAKAKVWHGAIMRALDRHSKSRADGLLEIDALADKLLELVRAGDLSALIEFGNRLDGKPAQAVDVTQVTETRVEELTDEQLQEFLLTRK